jgi:hypothetical protein
MYYILSIVEIAPLYDMHIKINELIRTDSHVSQNSVLNIKYSCLVLILLADYAMYITFQVTQLVVLYFCSYKKDRL